MSEKENKEKKEDIDQKVENETTNKKVKKFNFVSIEALEEEHRKFEEEKEAIRNSTNVSPIKRFYLNFETRVALKMTVVLILFGLACFFALKAINYGKNDIVSYSEISNAKYSVCLNENDFYQEKCLGEGMEYVSDMVNSVSADFDYKVDFSKAIDYDLTYEVNVITKITDKKDPSKIYYQGDKNLVPEVLLNEKSNNIDIKEKVSVDFANYNKFVTNYIEQYGLVDYSSTIDIVLTINDSGESKDVASISVPLGKKTFNITKSSRSNTNKTLEVNNDVWNEYNSIFAVIASILVIISLTLLYRTTKLVLLVTNNKNKYEAKLQQILREYDRLIVIARDGYESNIKRDIVKVNSFEELLAAQSTLKKPIIFSKVNNIKCEFIVEDNKTLYKYVMKEADL